MPAAVPIGIDSFVELRELELKVAGKPYKRTLKQALTQGRQQILTRNYRAELEAVGATPIQQLVVAFDGKTVKVEAVKG